MGASPRCSTVSTDDAYVNGHVTFVAPRVAGQVTRVLVDDNNRVRKGDLLVQLDKEPYQVQVNIAQAAVDAAQADLVAAQAEARGLEGQARSLRFNLRARDRGREQPGRAAALAGRRRSTPRRPRWRRRRPTTTGRCRWSSRGSVDSEEFDHRKRGPVGARRRSSRRHCRASTRFASRSACRPTPPTGDDLAAGPRRSGPDLLHGAGSAGRADADGGAARRGPFVQQVAQGR